MDHPTPRATLLSAVFWEILPSHYDKIKARCAKIANLYSSAKSDVIPTERAGAVNSLKAELDMLNHDLGGYRDIVKGIDITDIAGMYVVSGKSPHRALQIAKEDLGDLEESLGAVENRVREMRADIRYGLLEEK